MTQANSFSLSHLEDRLLGSLALAGMGDALGAPTEQWGIDEIRARFGGLVMDFVEPPQDTFAGANAGRRGEVTDDASQMYYLTRALIASRGSLDQSAWIACLLDWVRTSPKSQFMGPSTRALVEALHEGGDIAGIGVIGKSTRKMTTVGITNGAAMRVAPTGLVHPGDIAAACRLALVTCLPSHDTDVAISAACAIAAAASKAVVSDSIADVLDAAVTGAKMGEVLAREHARVVAGPHFLSRLELAMDIARNASSDAVFMSRTEALVGNSVLAAESVPAAIGVIAYAQGDPLRTIAIAASMGNDTDSIAAMAGSVVGALVGASALPPKMLAEFRLANEADFDLDAMACELARIAAARLDGTLS